MAGRTRSIVDALESADDQLRMPGSVLALTAAGSEGLANADVIQDICGVARESLSNIRATLDEASGALMSEMSASA